MALLTHLALRLARDSLGVPVEYPVELSQVLVAVMPTLLLMLTGDEDHQLYTLFTQYGGSLLPQQHSLGHICTQDCGKHMDRAATRLNCRAAHWLVPACADGFGHTAHPLRAKQEVQAVGVCYALNRG